MNRYNLWELTAFLDCLRWGDLELNNLITYFCKMWFIIITHYQKTIKIYLKPKYVNVRAIKCLNIVYYYRPNILQDILFSQKEEIRKENNIKRSETRESCKSAIK